MPTFCIIPDKCVDDLHILTEREWQDQQFKIGVLSEYVLRLEDRIKKLERSQEPKP